ncbi:MAG: GNAT family N-acetyltransferase [Pseudomonadota bacterium]|nr:GNAT family N-acetyltransferase [Pseudomonadota bacterium]
MQQYEVRIADSDHLVTAAQNLRYKVFFEELKGRSSLASKRLERDFDHFDQFCDHLVVIDRKEKNTSKSVIGTYRLMSRNQAALADGFYTSSEFDVSSILSFPGKS